MGFRDEDMLSLFGTQIMIGIVSVIIIIIAIVNPPLNNAETEPTTSVQTTLTAVDGQVSIQEDKN